MTFQEWLFNSSINWVLFLKAIDTYKEILVQFDDHAHQYNKVEKKTLRKSIDGILPQSPIRWIFPGSTTLTPDLIMLAFLKVVLETGGNLPPYMEPYSGPIMHGTKHLVAILWFCQIHLWLRSLTENCIDHVVQGENKKQKLHNKLNQLIPWQLPYFEIPHQGSNASTQLIAKMLPLAYLAMLTYQLSDTNGLNAVSLVFSNDISPLLVNIIRLCSLPELLAISVVSLHCLSHLCHAPLPNHFSPSPL